MKPYGTSAAELSRMTDQSDAPSEVSPKTPEILATVERGRSAAHVSLSPITDASTADDLHRPITKVGKRPKSNPPATRATLGDPQNSDKSPNAGVIRRHKFGQAKRTNSRDLRVQASKAISRRTIHLPQTTPIPDEPPLGSPLRGRYFAELLNLDPGTIADLTAQKESRPQPEGLERSRSPQLFPALTDRRRPVTDLQSVPNTPPKVPLAARRQPTAHARSTSVPSTRTPCRHSSRW